MQPRTMPVWLRNLLAVCIILVFSTGFYWFFIRPYAYRWKPCYGQKGYGVCMPCNYEVHGIDISHYQGKIDWELLTHNREAQFPIHFIFLKATEGGDHGDDTFTQNFGQARKYGFIRGAYHYFIPKTDARKQADFFIRTVQLAKGDLPPVLDVETTGKQSPQELKTADMKHYIARMNPGAELLMSGFYIDDIPVIREEAERNGLHFVHHREKNRWAAVKFQK